MDYKFGDIVIGNSNKYAYTHTNTHWMVIHAYKIRNFGEMIPRIRVVGTTAFQNRKPDFFIKYAEDLLGNYKRWTTGFDRATAYDMVDEMREWMRQFDRYERIEMATFEVDPAHFDMVKPYFISNKDSSSSLSKLED